MQIDGLCSDTPSLPCRLPLVVVLCGAGRRTSALRVMDAVGQLNEDVQRADAVWVGAGTFFEACMVRAVRTGIRGLRFVSSGMDVAGLIEAADLVLLTSRPDRGSPLRVTTPPPVRGLLAPDVRGCRQLVDALNGELFGEGESADDIAGRAHRLLCIRSGRVVEA